VDGGRHVKIEEFKQLAVRIEAWWPGSRWDKAMILVLFEELERFEFTQVLAAFELLKREHTIAFAPSTGEILRVLERGSQADRPSFDEAYPIIYRAASKQQLPEAHSLIVGFIEWQGLSRLGSLQLDHPRHGELVRKQLHEAWDRHVANFDGRQIAAISSGAGPRRLDALPSLTQIAEANDVAR
jgi:hypothetical protein